MPSILAPHLMVPCVVFASMDGQVNATCGNVTYDVNGTYDVNVTQAAWGSGDNGSHSDYEHMLEVVTNFVYPTVYAVGIIGNSFTILVWWRCKLQLPAVCYFMAICVSDNLVLLSHMLEMRVRVNVTGLCQLVHVFLLAVQVFAILLVLGMSVERYWEMCHPLAASQRHRYAKTWRNVGVQFLMSVALSAVEGYIWHVDGCGQCNIRPEILHGFVFYYGIIVVVLYFLLPIVAILFVNIEVCCSFRRTRTGSVAYGRSMATPERKSLSMSFIVVSLYLAVSELVYAVVHLSQYFSMLINAPNTMDARPLTGRWASYFEGSRLLLAGDIFSLTSYALDITVFTLSSRTFRRGAVKLLTRCKERRMSLAASSSKMLSFRPANGGEEVDEEEEERDEDSDIEIDPSDPDVPDGA